ncbi:MAG: hypothetical protein ACRCZH_01620 [Cetobacterium sp.]
MINGENSGEKYLGKPGNTEFLEKKKKWKRGGENRKISEKRDPLRLRIINFEKGYFSYGQTQGQEKRDP